ncbi:sensor histidine kinase [Caproiciproducens galactitolivorans]|uniref:histidine kinase n=1 Tax=Caproiciproducens galactitolivorans TaxID=642589 RepID=A0ABT4BUR3_9FIRM|nr:ATP-binding protein [Caproiciproducens galactitolivorans]MCY1713653.1 ATP-binding protein [Caproiciproducens galactitolivorans]
MKISIKVKLSVFLAIMLLAAVGLLSIMVLRGIQNNQKQQYEEYLTQQGEAANNYIKKTYLMQTAVSNVREYLSARSQALAKELELMSGMEVALFDGTGNELSSSRPAEDKEDVSSLLTYALQGKNAYYEQGSSIVFMSPVFSANEQIGAVEFVYSVEKGKSFYKDTERLFLLSASFAFALCLIAAYIYVHRLTREIMRMKTAVKRIQDGSFDQLPRLKRNDELGELSEGIYYMGHTIEKNIDEMRQEKDKLSLAVNKLEILGNQQKQFIGNVTHEFKNPLTVIKAYTDLMSMYAEDPNLIAEARDNIERETQRLSVMVERILELSALEKYDFELQMVDIDIADVLTEICGNVKGKIQKFGLHLHTSLEHHIIAADKESLTQIFINLMDNAIKYNRPGGEIWITCAEEAPWLNIVLRNTGMNIPLKERDNVFQPFYRAQQARSSEIGGTGLGLALVKGLVEKHGGTILVLDTVEDGTAFEIKLPLR